MTFTIDPNLIENNEVRLTEDNSGQLAIEHISSGNTITVDQDVAISDIATDTLPSNLDAQGNDISNVGSLSTDDIEHNSEAWQDVLSNRAPSQWYQNTTGYPLEVKVTAASNGNADDEARVDLDVNTSQSPNTVDRQNVQAATATQVTASVSATVPPSSYYQASSVSGTLTSWQESAQGKQ